jgi:hypothetical protein
MCLRMSLSEESANKVRPSRYRIVLYRLAWEFIRLHPPQKEGKQNEIEFRTLIVDMSSGSTY